MFQCFCLMNGADGGFLFLGAVIAMSNGVRINDLTIEGAIHIGYFLVASWCILDFL